MDEVEIIAGLRRGAAGAAGALLDQHGDRLLSSAYVLCGNAADAQDLCPANLAPGGQVRAALAHTKAVTCNATYCK